MIREVLRKRRKRRAARSREEAEAAEARLDDAAALDGYRRSLDLLPESYGVLGRAARLSQRLGDRQAAEAYWRRAAERRPDEWAVWIEAARLAFERGDPAQAASDARAALDAGAPGEPFLGGDAMRRLLAHIEAEPVASAPRHMAVCGVSYCGSTLLGYVLGALPGVANVGESHWLVNRRDGPETRAIDFARDPRSGWPPCNHCGPECAVFDDDARRALSESPVGWYARVAERAGGDVLVSSDKNPPKLRALDPELRFDAVVLFKTPTLSWSSTAKKAHVQTSLEQHLADWHETYAALIHDLPNRGRKLFLHFDGFRREPESHLCRLSEQLDLPFDPAALDRSGPPQHTFGGNPRAHETPRGAGSIERADDVVSIGAGDRERIAAYEARSPVLSHLLAEHRRVFGDG